MPSSMPLRHFLRLITCVFLLAVVSILLARKAEAGRFANLVAITVVAADGEVVTVPIEPVKISLNNRPLIRAATAPVRYVKQTVCGPNGCVEKLVPVAGCEGDCPCGPDCACDPCNCPTVAENPPPVTPLAVQAPQHSILVSKPRGDVQFMQRGPVRKLVSRVGNFIVKGGPIRQALRANRQARRGR